MNRQKMDRTQRRALDREATRSIKTIQAHLDFLNAAGNPKYKLVKQSDLSWKLKNIGRKLVFWS